jgi:hypothetical protein
MIQMRQKLLDKPSHLIIRCLFSRLSYSINYYISKLDS